MNWDQNLNNFYKVHTIPKRQYDRIFFYAYIKSMQYYFCSIVKPTRVCILNTNNRFRHIKCIGVLFLVLMVLKMVINRNTKMSIEISGNFKLIKN